MRMTSLFSSVLLIFLLLVSAAQEVGAATITGRMLMKDGTPISGGVVIIYDLQNGSPPAPEKYYFRPPDYGRDINNDGSFHMVLPQGTYNIGAIKRQDGRRGPPGEGDLFFILKDKDLKLLPVEIPAKGLIELGDIAAGKIHRPVSDPLIPLAIVSGTVRDKQGKPVIDVTVAAVPVHQRIKNALYFSQDTGREGTFKLKLPSGRIYILGIWEGESADEARKIFTKKIQVDSGGSMKGVDLTYQ